MLRILWHSWPINNDQCAPWQSMSCQQQDVAAVAYAQMAIRIAVAANVTAIAMATNCRQLECNPLTLLCIE